MRLPAWSKASTGGAPKQHSAIGGFSSAPFSLLLSVFELRWMIQMLSCASGETPMAEPRSQWFGSGLGQSGSTSNIGAWTAFLPCAVAVFSRAV